MKKALVACIENWDTLQEVPFVLHEGGCIVDVFCSKRSWLITNSYYNNWIESSDDEELYIKELITLAEKKNQPYDWIIPADEKLLKILNDAISSDELFYKILPLAKIENRDILASKAGLSRFCQSHSIASPKYIIYDHKNNFDASSLQLNYPVLLKQDLSWGGGGILFCENEEAFKKNILQTNKAYSTIIQEYITGKDIGVEALFRNGELLECNTGEVLIYFGNKFNFTTKRKYFNNNRLVNELRNIGKQIGINGFASIQFIYKPEDDIYYLLEVDMRPNIWVPYGRFTGHNFSEAVKKFLDPASPAEIKNIDEEKVTEVAFFYRDIIRCFKFHDFKGILQWLFNYKQYWRFVPTYDKVLFKKNLKELLGNKIKKRIAGLFKIKSKS
ncbi:MAG: ATP-grasp domain-containing protein [Bacteroidota bacterium]|nr:ATP-grasp domain-containing protein [Bacteroidota bacterium]